MELLYIAFMFMYVSWKSAATSVRTVSNYHHIIWVNNSLSLEILSCFSLWASTSSYSKLVKEKLIEKKDKVEALSSTNKKTKKKKERELKSLAKSKRKLHNHVKEVKTILFLPPSCVMHTSIFVLLAKK